MTNKSSTTQDHRLGDGRSPLTVTDGVLIDPNFLLTRTPPNLIVGSGRATGSSPLQIMTPDGRVRGLDEVYVLFGVVLSRDDAVSQVDRANGADPGDGHMSAGAGGEPQQPRRWSTPGLCGLWPPNHRPWFCR